MPTPCPLTARQGENFLQGLGKLCQCIGKHQVCLSGWTPPDLGDRVMQPTKSGCSSYPVRLCKAWAKFVAKALDKLKN